MTRCRTRGIVVWLVPGGPGRGLNFLLADIESRGWDCWTCEPVEGGCLDPVCSLLGLITDNYPWYDSYSFAGPNSNTFVAYMANQLGMDVEFDPLDAGAGYEDR